MSTENNLLPLSVVKNYLRLDDDFNDDDDAIERMVRSAFGYIEKQTSYVFSQQERTYFPNSDGIIKIFDYPFKTASIPEGITPLFFPGYIRIDGSQADSVTLTVGYAPEDSDKVPSALIDCALQIIKVWYYEAETNGMSENIPANATKIINTYRRCIAF